MTGDQVQVIPPAGARRSLDALRDQIAPDATDDELNYLAALGRRFDLDPVAGQIVLVSRFDKRLGRNVSRPQITADGRLALAQRSGELDGFDGPQWCGPRNAKGGHDWLDLWSDDEPPHAARVYVYRKGRAHAANGTVRWAEFAQRKANGELMPMWAAMPSHMLGKVALSLGLRRAFPGIVPGDIDDSDDEMLDDSEPPPARAIYPDAGNMIAEDHRAFLNFALDKLGPDAKAWLLPVKNADKIPSVGAEYFKVAHRDRLAWHILHAQQIAEAEPDVPDADEPVPADVHDGHRTGMMAEQNADSVRQSDSTLWSFEHFFHIDKANACMHCAPVRFSPITFRLLADLLAMWSDDEDITQEMAEVKYHQGQYELDPGR